MVCRYELSSPKNGIPLLVRPAITIKTIIKGTGEKRCEKTCAGGKGSRAGKCDGNDSLRGGERRRKKVCMKVGKMEF